MKVTALFAALAVTTPAAPTRERTTGTTNTLVVEDSSLRGEPVTETSPTGEPPVAETSPPGETPVDETSLPGEPPSAALEIQCPLELCPLSPEGIAQLRASSATFFARVGWSPADWTMLVDWEHREAFRLGLWLARRSAGAVVRDDPQTRHATCEACTELQVVEAGVGLVADLVEDEERRRGAALSPPVPPPPRTPPQPLPSTRMSKTSAVGIGVFFGGFAAMGITTIVVADLQRRQAPGLPPLQQDHFATYLGTALGSACFLVAAVTLLGVELAASRKAKRTRPVARTFSSMAGLGVAF